MGKDDTKIVEDALELGILVEACLGCGRATDPEGAKAEGVPYKDCGCPAGTTQRWNRSVLDMIERNKKG